jgi:hypothetical protein
MHRPVLFLFTLLFLPLSLHAAVAAPLAAWVQLGDTAEVRAVVADAACPTLLRDGRVEVMVARAPASADFPLICSAPVASDTKLLSLDGKVLPLPTQTASRILIVGDTGCRITVSQLQACNDPKAWVFPKLAAAASALKPDLVIHLGDYVSRESACPARFSGCEGSPFGDNWGAWSADLFSPAAPLLAAAPVIFARGNHEDCNRQGPGWLRLMGSGAFDQTVPCALHVAPYAVRFGSVTLAVLDTASAPETETVDSMASAYAEDLQSLAKLPSPVWMLQHRPIWGAISGPLDIPIGGNLTLGAAIRKVPIPANVELMLSGHIHGFEAMNYYSGVPPQIISGNGGDLLHDIPRILKGAIFQGTLDVTVKDGVSASDFGFLLMTKTDGGWTIDAYDADGNRTKQCHLKDRRVDCD